MKAEDLKPNKILRTDFCQNLFRSSFASRWAMQSSSLGDGFNTNKVYETFNL